MKKAILVFSILFLSFPTYAGKFSSVTLKDSTDTSYIYRVIRTGIDTHDIQIPKVWSWASEVEPRRKLNSIVPQEWEPYIVKIGIFYGDYNKDFALYYFTGDLLTLEPYHVSTAVSHAISLSRVIHFQASPLRVDPLGRVVRGNSRMFIQDGKIRTQMFGR